MADCLSKFDEKKLAAMNLNGNNLFTYDQQNCSIATMTDACVSRVKAMSQSRPDLIFAFNELEAPNVRNPDKLLYQCSLGKTVSCYFTWKTCSILRDVIFLPQLISFMSVLLQKTDWRVIVGDALEDIEVSFWEAQSRIVCCSAY